MKRRGPAANGGFTLAEMLIVIGIIAVVMATAVPLLSTNEPQKLALVAENVTSALRLAIGEARRTGKYVLVDGLTEAGKFSLYISTSSAQLPNATGTSPINDPLTKRALIVDPGLNSLSRGVVLTPQFNGAGQPRRQLLIGPGASQLIAFDGEGNSFGALQAGSGVLLTLGDQSLMVSIDPVSGLVTRP